MCDYRLSFAPMGASLKYRSGEHQGRTVKLRSDLTRLGRSSDNDLVFREEIVSSHHAEIRKKGSAYYLIDLDSSNGTLINGRTVEKTQLRDRDRIELGEGGPSIEFLCEGATDTSGPTVFPLSGAWDQERQPIALEHGTHTLGRSLECSIVVGRTHGSVVSSQHARISVHSRYCELEDLDSSNGTFVNGERIDSARLKDGDRVELGSGGPVFEFQWAGAADRPKAGAANESERMFRKLERAARGGRAGEQTMLFLHAATRFHKRRRGPLLILSCVILAGALVTGYLYYREYKQNEHLRALATDLFYQMRSDDMQLVEKRDLMDQAEFTRITDERRKRERMYDEYLRELGLYEGKTEVQKAVMRLARRLGETDLQVPAGFYKTTLDYVEKWRSTPRLRTALDRARQQQLPQIISKALDQYGLPREFFFIPLQESNYDPRRVGPSTRYGYAKGMWQMIPTTAQEYHLRLGPLKDSPQYDASDQRQDMLASTHAAVQYLAYLYSTKAAASGLLVIASYNYGQTRILRKLDELPNDPKQRNFWNFYRNGWIPDETRDYVMYIFSAALICEKPELFQMNIEPVMAGW